MSLFPLLFPLYDVFDHLIERDLDPTGGGTYTQVAHYVWDITQGGQADGGVALQFNGQQQLTNRYLNGPNVTASDQYFSDLAEESVSSVTSPGTVTFNLLDNEDTLHDIVNASGTVEDHVVDTAFGQLFSESNPATPHLTGYAGGMPDAATQLVNFRERWLDPSSAVWLAVDPLGYYAGDTNLSRYVGNDPANAIDPSGLAGVGHHYVPVSVLNTLRQDGLITDAAYALAMGYTSGETLPSHHFGTYGGVSHDAYNKEVLAMARAEAKKSPTGRLNARQMREFVDKKILGDKCPNNIKRFNAEINSQRKAFLTEEARTAKRPPKALRRVKGPPQKPPTNTELIAKGRRFMSSRGFALAAVAGPLAGILDTFIGDTVGAMEKVSSSNSFREVMAGLTAGDLDRANRAMGDLDLQTGVLGEVIDASSYKQAVLLRDAWQSAVGDARAAQYRNFELKWKAELDDGPPEPAPVEQVPAEPAPPTIYDGVNELVPGGRGPVEE